MCFACSTPEAAKKWFFPDDPFSKQNAHSLIVYLVITDKAWAKGGERQKVFGVMKDKELKLEEIEASRTLGGAREGHVQGRGHPGQWRKCRSYSV